MHLRAALAHGEVRGKGDRFGGDPGMSCLDLAHPGKA